MSLSADQLEALFEVVTRHGEDEQFYLDGTGDSSPEKDYKDEELADLVEIRRRMWTDCADAAEALNQCVGVVNQLRSLASQWESLAKKQVAA